MSGTRERDEKFRGAPAPGRSTGELMRIIEDSGEIGTALRQMEDDFSDSTFGQLLSGLMADRGIRTSALAERSRLSRSFVYQLCSGDREPGREVVLRLAFVLKAGLRDAQRLLHAAGRGTLYPRVRRDAVLIYGLKNGMELPAVNELLSSLGEEPILLT